MIAGGAISTPELLFRSRIRPHALGRYLSYHPLAVCQIVVSPELCSAGDTGDVDPRIEIRPGGETPWYTLVLHDVSPFDPTGNDREISPNRLSRSSRSARSTTRNTSGRLPRGRTCDLRCAAVGGRSRQDAWRGTEAPHSPVLVEQHPREGCSACRGCPSALPI